MIIKYIFIAICIYNFFRFALSVKNIFVGHSESIQIGYTFLKITNVLMWVTSIYFFTKFHDVPIEKYALYLATVIQLIVAYTFGQAKKIGKSKLTLAFSLDAPQKILQDGPYKYVRHPFYFCYLVCYFTIAFVISNPIVWGVFFMNLAIYLWAAKVEEGKFLKSNLSDEYKKYIKSTGMFFPNFIKMIVHRG